jgi:hypothetical protein
MLSNIDTRIVAVVVLIIGLIGGYFVNDSLISRPKIEALENSILTQESHISELETAVESLETERDSIQSDYDELETSTNQEIEEKNTEISNLEDQIESYTDLVSEQEESILELSSTLDELEDDYDDLIEKYNEVYNPLNIEFEIDDLEFKLTISTDIYEDNVPIHGTVEIRYSDGTDFRGTFKLNLYKVYISAGSTSEEYEIRGATTYQWNNPFVTGPGSYKLGFTEVKNRNGDTVVTNAALREYQIYVFMG